MAHFLFRSQHLAGLLAATMVMAASPAFAKKKPATEAPGGGDWVESGLPTSGKKEGGAQSSDQERPKPILEEEDTGPASDEKGNVKFAGPKAGKGKITVNAPVGDKAKVYLEGRFFGVAPKTINGIPPGDYIIEVTYPNGKSVTKPVSVIGDEESVLDLGGEAEATAPVAKPMAAEQAAKRWRMAEIVGIASVGVLLVGGGLGVWELSVQSDYNKTPGGTDNQAKLDSLRSKGQTLALAADICFVGAAVGLIAAGIIGYPAYKARKGERRSESTPDAPPEPPPMSFLFAPTPGGASAGMSLTF